MHNEKIKMLADIISEAARIVFIGGAGVSTESGIPDFRSKDGLYSQKYDYPPEMMLSHSFFVSHPVEFYKFYRDKMIIEGVRPNKAHYALAALERAGKLTAVVTQNIDGLHQQAGSEKVLELHGSVHRNYCMSCGRFHGIDAVNNDSPIPRCGCGGIIKPDVVLYEEPLDGAIMREAEQHISKADVMIVGGTSLAVYPAAGLVDFFGGKSSVVINKAPTPFDRRANLLISEKIGETLSSACALCGIEI